MIPTPHLTAVLALALCYRVRVATAAEQPDVLFTVFPSPVGRERHGERVRAILDTWGKGQRVVVVSSEADEQPVDGTPVWHFPDVVGKIGEQSMRAYLSKAMEESWDWLYRVDDCSLVLVPNLMKLLEQYDPSRPVLMGSKIALPGTDKVYFTGGPGWAVSRPAVQLFLDNWCPPTNDWFRDEVFDIQMHTCMVRHLGVQAESPRDEVDGVGAKFNTYSPVRSFKGPYDQWFSNYKKAAKETIVNGHACCARYPVAFHYLEAGEIRSFYRIFMEPHKWKDASPREKLDILGTDVSPYSSTVSSEDDPVLDYLTEIRVFGIYSR